jgi:hypothetical protein
MREIVQASGRFITSDQGRRRDGQQGHGCLIRDRVVIAEQWGPKRQGWGFAWFLAGETGGKTLFSFLLFNSFFSFSFFTIADVMHH